MPELQEIIQRLGPEVAPFERKGDASLVVQEEEKIDFSAQAFNAIKDGAPEPRQDILMTEVRNLPKEKMFIWLIFLKKGEIHFRMIPDSKENAEGKKNGGRANVCHTNLSAGEKALQGGECWWCEELRTIYVNPQSGRYGADTMTQWKAVLDFFRFVGYENVTSVMPKKWKLKA